jgi:hypothetical protein
VTTTEEIKRNLVEFARKWSLYDGTERAEAQTSCSGYGQFEDDYSMGILSSSAHVAWSRARSSTLRRDYRYTPSTAFTSFVWPSPSARASADVAEAAKGLVRLALLSANATALA